MTHRPPNPSDPVTAVQQQFVRHTGVIRGFILALLPNVSAAEDVLQEVFLTVTEKAESFEPGTNFVGWACAIARLKVLEATRRLPGRHVALSPAVIARLADEAPLEDVGAGEPVALLLRCMGELAPRAREVVELRYREALKPAGIAQRIGWTANAVTVALSRARTTLRRCVERRLDEREAEA